MPCYRFASSSCTFGLVVVEQIAALPTRVPTNDSIVLTFAFATDATVVMHERVATPFTCTLQTPHKPSPRPNFCPVI